MKKKNIIIRFISNIYVRNLLLMAFIVCILVLGALLFLNIYTKHNESIVVPAIKGLQVEDAAGILKSHDLAYEVIDSVYQARGVPGAITEQIPIEKSKVKKGRTIFLIVHARGEQMVTIPSLQDFSQRQAEAQLNALGFNNIAITETTATYAGLVVSVSYRGKEITPGQKIPKGAALTLLVGAGGETLEDSTSVSVPTTPDSENSTEGNSFFD